MTAIDTATDSPADEVSTYTVTFEYRVEGTASPVEAAARAYAMLTARRPVATVTSEHGHSDEIDLETEEG